MQTPTHSDKPAPAATRRAAKFYRWTLVLPYLALCFPALYARSTPTLFGFPFFYWYQFAWVLLASALIFLAYRNHRD